MTDKEKMKKEFSAWFRKKQVEFITKKGQRSTDKEFAEWLGVPSYLIGRWLSGEMLPSEGNVILIANKLGERTYELLGWPIPSLGRGVGAEE